MYTNVIKCTVQKLVMISFFIYDDESDDLTLFYVLTFDPPYLRDRYRVLKLSVLQ